MPAYAGPRDKGLGVSVENVAKIRELPRLARLVANPARAAQLLASVCAPDGKADSNEVHLRAAMRWLCRAQDAVSGGGLSYGYSLLKGWLPPYPETTGYIINTFLAYARHTGNQEYRDRAARMGKWEFSEQLTSGGIPGVLWAPGQSRHAVSFDTGQVIQGWCALYEETRQKRFLDAAIRAADWLLEAQRPDGAWQDTAPGRSEPTTFAFNTRTSWALVDLSLASGDDTYRSAALRNLEWVLQLQRPNGWFRHAGFSMEEVPLTHTLGYVLEGLLECWQRTREPRLLEAAQRGAWPLLEAYVNRPFLPATFDSDWKPQSRFACVTGCSQMVRVWLLLYGVDRDLQKREAALKLLNQVKTWQIVGARDGAVEGALPGSIPVYGRYEPLRFPNWGVKFFCDALLAAIDVESESVLAGGSTARD